MLNNDTLTNIQKTAVEANSKRVYKADAEPDHVYLIADASGNLERQIAIPEPLAHKPTDFHSVVALAHTAEFPGSEPAGVVSLWCSLDGIVAVLSEDRRGTAKLDLSLSKPFAQLQAWDNTGVGGVHLDQVAVYTLFRSLFRGALNSHPTIRDDIRKVDISKAQQAAGEVSRTAVSMSKKLIAEASGADKLPEVLMFKVPVFAEAVATIEATVSVAFDLDPQQEKFRFIVLPNEIEKAIADAEDWLERQVQAINENKVPVYRGTP